MWRLLDSFHYSNPTCVLSLSLSLYPHFPHRTLCACVKLYVPKPLLFPSVPCVFTLTPLPPSLMPYLYYQVKLREEAARALANLTMSRDGSLRCAEWASVNLQPYYHHPWTY